MKWRITSTSLSSGRCSSFRSSSSGRSTFSAVGTCSVFLLFRSNNVFIFPLYENPWNCQRQHDPLMVGPYDRCNRSGFFCFFQGMGGFRCICPLFHRLNDLYELFNILFSVHFRAAEQPLMI